MSIEQATGQATGQASPATGLNIKYKLLNGGSWPKKSYSDDAGFDLVANGDAEGKWADGNPFLGTVYSGCTLKVKCGFAMAIPRGWFADIRSRSGMATKLRVLPANTPGTVDAGYRDELSVVLMNLGPIPLVVNRGDRIAQMLFLPVPDVVAEEVNELPASERGVSSYGSTGK